MTTLEWLDNDDKQLINTTDSVAVLEIESITTEHHNLVYTCRAVSPFGNQTKSVTIRVTEEVSPVAGIAGGLAAALIIIVLIIVVIIIVLLAVKRYVYTNRDGYVLTTL